MKIPQSTVDDCRRAFLGESADLCNSSGLHVQAPNFAGRAFGHNFQRTTANFAIGGEALEGNAGVHNDLEILAAKGADDGFGFFHRMNVAPNEENAKCSRCFEWCFELSSRFDRGSLISCLSVR